MGGSVKKIFLTILIILTLNSVSFAEQKKKLITVNLQDVEITNVVKFISDVTGKNFIYDDNVKGKVTIIAPSKISADEAYNLFTAVLNLKGYTVVPSAGNLLKIIPSRDARSSSPDSDKINESYVTKLVPVQYANPEITMRFLQPLISKDGHISIFGSGEYLLVVESATNIKRLEHILSFIDKPALKETPEIIYLKNAFSEDVVKFLTDTVLKKDRQDIKEDIKVFSDSRLNALIIIGSQYIKEYVKKVIDLIDVPAKDIKGNIYVYSLENADATELSKVMESTVKNLEEVKGGKQPQDKSKISITPDKSTNSLIISCPPNIYPQIESIIKNLDKRRKQVFVEAMIVEASIDKLKELGSKWRTVVRKNNEPVAITGFGTVDSGTMLSVINGLSGFSVGGIGNFFDIPNPAGTGSLTIPGFTALFSLNEFKDAVNVLSTPQILTSDNKEAEIVVGENVPFISKREQTTGTTSLQSYFNVIERKDVGINLKITPQITEGEYVKLDIYQEISSLKQVTKDELLTLGPSTTKRSTKTSVVVKDKQTVVISGLMQEKTEEIITKVPFLGDIPLLGFLFRFKSYETRKTNLLVFLTPHIIRDSAELAMLTERKITDYSNKMGEETFNEAIVKLKENVSYEDFEKFLKENKMSIKKKIMERMYLIEIPPDRGFQEIKELFMKKGIIEYIEPNLKVRKAE